MKTFLVVVLSITALYLWQRQRRESASPAQKPATAEMTAAATPRPVSEHNWAKHSLDRAHEVVDEVQQSRAPNEQP